MKIGDSIILKIGDRLICKKNVKDNCYDGFIFIKDNYYDIIRMDEESIVMMNEDNDIDCLSIFDKKEDIFFNLFYTQKELRSKKLETI